MNLTIVIPKEIVLPLITGIRRESTSYDIYAIQIIKDNSTKNKLNSF